MRVRCHHLHYIIISEYTTHRVYSASQCFPHCYHIRLHVVPLTSKQFASTTQACLDLVSNEQDIVLLTERLCLLQVSFRRNNDPCLALNWFDEQSSIVRIVLQHLLKHIQVIVLDEIEIHPFERSEVSVSTLLLRRSNHSNSASHEIAFTKEDSSLVFRNPFDLVGPSSGNFEWSLNRFDSSVHHQYFLISKQISQILSSLSEQVVVESFRNHIQLTDLLAHCWDYFRMIMTLIYSGIGSQEVHISLAIYISHIKPFSSWDNHLNRRIVVGGEGLLFLNEVWCLGFLFLLSWLRCFLLRRCFWLWWGTPCFGRLSFLRNSGLSSEGVSRMTGKERFRKSS